MKKIFFAVMAFAVVVLTAGCNKNEDFLKASLSVEEVTEHSIKVRCTYVPQKKDDAGYLLLRSTTDQIDDEMRKELVELYPMVEPNHESGVFACDSLAADRLYYFWAVSYQRQKNGEVTIANIETLSQRTLASNDSRVNYTQNDSNVTFTVLLRLHSFRFAVKSSAFPSLRRERRTPFRLPRRQSCMLASVVMTWCFWIPQVVCMWMSSLWKSSSA